jgi:L-arabinonolactonase
VVETMVKAEVALAAGALVGEGPVWSVEERALYWVDVPAGTVHRFEPGTGATRSWQLPAEVGCIALRSSGGAIAALRTGLCLVDFETGEVEALFDPEAHQPRTRFNDGKCDRQGRLWAGTMDIDEKEPLGALYCFSGGRGYERMLSAVGMSNGLGWSPDDRTMYHTDSLTRVISAYDYDSDTGALGAARPFVCDRLPAVPDGLAVDAGGCVWSVKWDAWRVVRYTPDGRVDREISLPVQQPTSCAFGGSDLDVLFVTSAREGLSAAALTEQPLAGSVFAVEVGAQGLPQPLYRG